MKIKLDWLHTDSIKETNDIAERYNISISIEFPHVVVVGATFSIENFVFNYYNNVVDKKLVLSNKDFYDRLMYIIED